MLHSLPSQGLWCSGFKRVELQVRVGSEPVNLVAQLFTLYFLCSFRHFLRSLPLYFSSPLCLSAACRFVNSPLLPQDLPLPHFIRETCLHSLHGNAGCFHWVEFHYAACLCILINSWVCVFAGVCTDNLWGCEEQCVCWIHVNMCHITAFIHVCVCV